MIPKGVLFGDVHSFEDLNLLLAPFTPAPAQPKTYYVEKAGGDGALDFTEALGEVRYSDRTFTFTFTINPDETMPFDEKVTQVANTLNGKKCKIILDRDSEWYWEGRLSINQYLQDKQLGQIVINARVAPYKLKCTETTVSFDLEADEEKTVTVYSGRKTLAPVIVTTGNRSTVTYKGETLILTAGEHSVFKLWFTDGGNPVTLTSTGGKVSFVFREGAL